MNKGKEMKKGTHLKEAEFNAIKELTNYISSDQKVALLTGRGSSTVWAARRFDSYKAYREYTQQRSAQIRSKRAAKQAAADPEVNPLDLWLSLSK